MSLEDRLAGLDRVNGELLLGQVSPRLEYWCLRLYGWGELEAVQKVELRYQHLIESKYRTIGGY